MRIVKKLISLLLALCLALALSVSAFAAGEEYTYTVRIYAGASGTINGSSVVVYEDLHYGDRITFNTGSVTVTDERYYVKGIRESGMDNSTVGTPSFTVTGDMDYVVAYGVKGTNVAYTVNYLDADGNALAQSETYYGNVGDNAVAAYKYIEGYRPQAYNLGRYLVSDASSNVISFVYTAVSTTTTETETSAVQQAPAAEEAAQPEEAAEPGEEATTPEESEEPAEEIAGEPDEEIPGDEDEEEPEEYIQLDDDETPLEEGLPSEQTVEESTNATPVGAYVGGGIGIILILAAVAAVVLSRKKKSK